MNKFIGCLLLLFIFSPTIAQRNEKWVQIELIESEVKQTKIRNAQVLVNTDKSFDLYISDSKGTVSFHTRASEIKLNISHVGFFSKDTLLSLVNYRDSAKIVIYLDVKTYMSSEVVIQNPFEPIRLFGSSRVSVDDFELLPDNRMLLLTYERKLNKGAELLLVDENEKIKSHHDGGGGVKEIVRDFRGNIHLITESSVYHVDVNEEHIDLYRIDKNYFLTYVAPIIDTADSKLFFSNYQEIYPAVDYFSFDRLDSVYKKIVNIEDEIMMEMYLAEYKWVDVRTKLWAREMERELGVEKEIIIGASIFTNSILYKEIYAPLFVKDDEIYVFDFYKDVMLKYDLDANLLDSLSIQFHHNPKRLGWKNKLLQDSETGELFAVYEKAGITTLRHINLTTGNTDEGIQLHYKYVDKLAIQDNSAFYIYRPFESAQKKFLFKERLPIKYDYAKSRNDNQLVKNGRYVINEIIND